MSVRVIAMDLDDTLLDPTGNVTERTKRALAEAMRRGVCVVLASGRMPAAMTGIARAIGANGPAIAFNGALTIDLATGAVEARTPVPNALAREAAALAEARGAHIQAFRDGTYYYAAENEYSRLYAASIHLNGVAAGAPLSTWFTGEADKLLAIEKPENIARWVGAFQAHFGDRLHCAISRPNYIEIFNAKADKAVALDALAKRRGFDKTQVAAFGDGENDLPMIDYAGWGYVMSNARPPILSRAKRLAPSNAEDGIAVVVEGWLRDGTIEEARV